MDVNIVISTTCEETFHDVLGISMDANIDISTRVKKPSMLCKV